MYGPVSLTLPCLMSTDDNQYTQPPPHQNRLYNEELGYIAPPNRKLPPIPGSTYSTLGSQVKRMPGGESGSRVRPGAVTYCRRSGELAWLSVLQW